MSRDGRGTPDLDAMEREPWGERAERGTWSGNGNWNSAQELDGETYSLQHMYPSENDEETLGLLGGKRRPRAVNMPPGVAAVVDPVVHILTKRVTIAGMTVPWVLFLLLFLPLLLLLRTAARSSSLPQLPVLSNGTHSFHRTTVVISIDGFRPGYLRSNADQLPNLLKFRDEGVYAQMQPVFPTLTFPNHWSILTGLYPSSHGIMANTFYRPGEGEFDYGSPSTSWDGHWWRGEPLWSVAERKGRRALNYMWPGPPVTEAKIAPSFFHQYALKTTNEKYDELINYFDKPLEDAPSLLFMYLPDVDQAGHASGPDGAKVSDALRRVDKFVGDVRSELAKRNMSDIVDLIVVSDHGMASLSESRIVYYDDILGDLAHDIAHRDGWPSFGLWFKDGVDYTPHVAKLKAAMDNNVQLSVYTHDTMPERWHLAADHVAPVYLVPDVTWLLGTHADYADGLTVFGAHGYDNVLPEMQAAFFVDGPAAKQMKANAGGAGWMSTKPAVMSSFRNVELFNLICRLQDMGDYAPPNNGTVGFWDRYLAEN